jgi:hypothetical protein
MTAAPARALFALLLSLLPFAAAACSCVMYDSPEDAERRAPIAVEAEMLSLRREESVDALLPPAHVVEVVRWKVTRSMRGPLAPAQTFETRTTVSPAMCGQQVVQPLSASNRNGRLRRHWRLFFNGAADFIATCSRSQPIDP